MRSIQIAEVTVDQGGSVAVTPRILADENLEFIYRAGRGVTWNPGRRVLVARGVGGSAAEAFSRIVAAVEGEYGIHLESAPDTKWTNVSDELRRAMMVT